MNRRRLRLAVIAVLALMAGAAVGLAVLPEIARRVVVWRLGVMTGRAVTLDGLDLRLFRGHLVVRGLRVMDHDGGILATLDRLEARARPLDLLRGRLHLVDGTLDALTLRIVRTGPREFNVSDLVRPKTDAGGGSRFGVTIERFAARNVAAVIEDRTVTPARTSRVTLEADVQDASTVPGHRAGTASLRATVAGAPVSLEVTDLRLAPLRLRASFTARDVDASLLSLALPPGGLVSVGRGAVSASARIEHDAATGSLIGLEVGLQGIELNRYHTAFVTAPAVRVTVESLRVRPGAVEVDRVGVDGGTVTLADAQLGTSRRWQLDAVTFEARNLSSARDATPGTATASATMAGATLSLWGGNVRLAPLELHAALIVRNMDLAVLRAYLPPALPVQPERGVVNATLRIEHDGARGTRLNLDAGLTGIGLQRPGHFVTAPAVRVLAENVALDRGAVTIGRLAVDSDRLTLEERDVKPVRTWPVQDLAVEAKDLSSRPGAVQGVATLRATVAGAAVSAWVTGARLDPLELRATTVVRNLDVALLRLYLPPETLVEFTRGTVNASVQVDHTAAEGTRVVGDATVTGMEARGRWRLSTMSVSAPTLRLTLAEARRQGPNLSIGRVELNGAGTLTDTRAPGAPMHIAQLRIASEGLTWPARAPARVEVSARFGDRGELDVSGTAQLTAPLPTIAWTAELALAFRRVDLTPLAVYVPAARGIGGRVRANVAATLKYAGTLTARLRGDVAGGRFALAEGDRPLVSLRRIDATGLDVQWPERVTIAQVRLREPSAHVERDRQGRFTLMDRFASPDAAEAAPAPAPREARTPFPPIAIGELIVENGRAVVVDVSGGVATRVELPRVNVTARDVTWPVSKPARITVDADLPGGGSAKVEGTVTGEPRSVDVKVALTNADLAVIQPLLPFRAAVRGRLDTTLAVAGPLAPAPRLTVRGDAGIRSFVIADGAKPLITVERIDVGGIDGVWPEQIAVDRVRVGRAWAHIERDRQGGFPLQTIFERRPAPLDMGAPQLRTPKPPLDMGAPQLRTPKPPSGPAPGVALTVREIVLEQQSATIVDAVPTPAARFDIAGARMTVQNLTWPSRGPMKAVLSTPMPGGGRLDVSGTLELTPLRIDARATLDAVSIEPAQPYLPIEGKVRGQVTGDVAVKVALQPVSIQVTGQTHLQRFGLNDGDRPVVTVGRMEVTGIDVDWPRRLAVETVLLRRPRLLVERDPLGRIRLWQVAVPNWSATPSVGGPAPAATAAPAPPSPPAPVIEITTFRVERASARFVDQSTTPTYAEELSNVDLTATPLTSAPDGRTRFTATGAVGGGTFKARGEAAMGDQRHVELTVDLRDFIVPRANPYLDLYTGWTATRGSLSLTGAYTVTGARLETRHDVVVRDLDVEAVDTRDEVEHRVGLPFGLLVSLLKDSRGVIKLSLPVAGDLATRSFEFQDALWGAVRALALRLVALPFSRIGSLFVSEDSKVEAVAITPVSFEPGTATLGAGMDAHLQKVAGFLRDAPAVTLALRAIFTQADADALKAGGDASEAMRTLGAARLGAVRASLGRAGIDAARLPGRVPRQPFIEAAGGARVEMHPRVKEALDEVSRGG